MIQNRGWRTLSVKDQRVNMLAFMGCDNLCHSYLTKSQICPAGRSWQTLI